MKCLSLTLLGVAAALRLELNDAAAPKKNRPVSKVINLLKDMSKQLETEAEQDEETYKKMECWCTENNAEKTEAIAAAETKLKNLQAAIEEGLAKSAQLVTEIENLEKEIAEETEALKQATAIREKEAAEFNEKNKDILQAISALKSAITVLKKHQSNSSGPTNVAMLSQTEKVVDHLFNKFGKTVLKKITRRDQNAVVAFLQVDGVNPYANQSGQIFGILQNMLDTFIADNKEAMDEEAAAQKAFDELKEEKETLIASMQDQVDKKSDIKAQTDAKVAADKQDKQDTTEALGEDEKYLTMLKEKCAMTDEEFAARQKTRTEEIAAVSKALEFLNSDEAHDLFTSTFNFVQTQKKDTLAIRRQKAARVLSRFPVLSVLANKVKLDAFTKVKAAIDKMVADIKEQMANDVKQRDSCVANFHDNEKATTAAEQQHEDLTSKKEKLEQDIENATKTIKQLEEVVENELKEMKVAGENRAKENAEFQVTVKEQRASVAILTKAMEVLQSFYEKNDKSFMQVKNGEPAGPPPPAGFKAYSNNSGGNSVIKMITQIINDAKALEAEAIRDEKDSQSTYEEELQESNALVKESRKQIEDTKNNRATMKTDLLETEQALKDTEHILEALHLKNEALHTECDFLLKNFEIRQEAMTQEVDALNQAKAILSGSDFTETK